MALGITEAVANINDATDGTTYSFASFTPSANSVLVAMFTVYGSNTDVGTVSDSGMGLTWTKRKRTVWNTANEQYTFEATVGASPSATVVTLDLTGDGATGACGTLFEITGTSVTFVQIKDNTGSSGGSPSVTMDSNLNTNNCYVLAGGNPANPPTVDPPTNWTETFDGGHVSSEGGFSAYRVNGETGTTVTLAEGVSGTSPWVMHVAEYAEGGASWVPERLIGAGISRGATR